MKPKDVAFLAVAVTFRTGALATALFGFFTVLVPLILAPHASGGALLRMSLVYLLGAALLWVIAKPAASLVLRGLDVGSRFDLDEYRRQ